MRRVLPPVIVNVSANTSIPFTISSHPVSSALLSSHTQPPYHPLPNAAMHLVLTGATGLVGSAVLRSMLHDPMVTKVTILSRRAVPQASGHPKARVILHSDFADYSGLARETLADARGVVWALGISSAAVDKAAYEQITYAYPLAFARYWNSVIATDATDTTKNTRSLVFVSGEGATHTPSFYTPRFGVVKGRAEADLLNLTASADNTQNLTVWAARPGGVDPRQDPDVLAVLQPRFSATKKTLLAAVGAVSPASMMSPTKPLGEALVALAKRDHHAGPDEVRVEKQTTSEEEKGWRGGVVRNAELRRLAGL